MDRSAERIGTLDVIRGVAVLGILLMNIVGFGLVEAAYVNPRAQGGATGPDLAVYVVNFVLFDGKMRGLFSLLFGASMLLVIERAEARGGNGTLVHASRMVWLLAFGLLHLWFVWWGDILSHYALVGLIAMFFRKLPVPLLVATGCAFVVLGALNDLSLPFGVWAAERGIVPSGGDPADLAAIREGFAVSLGVPPAPWIADDVALHRGPFWTLLAHDFRTYGDTPITGFVDLAPETLAYFLFGMAALRGGLLTGDWPRGRYRRWAAIGFGIGLPASLGLAAYLIAAGFSTLSVALAVVALPGLVRPAMVVGWACLIILASARGGWLVARIAAAGRMAFTNYLATSLVCTWLFTGLGLGLFATLSRGQLYIVVAGVWALILLWSLPWLERFAYGPLEWLWRSGARGRLQAMRPPAIATRTQ